MAFYQDKDVKQIVECMSLRRPLAVKFEGKLKELSERDQKEGYSSGTFDMEKLNANLQRHTCRTREISEFLEKEHVTEEDSFCIGLYYSLGLHDGELEEIAEKVLEEGDDYTKALYKDVRLSVDEVSSWISWNSNAPYPGSLYWLEKKAFICLRNISLGIKHFDKIVEELRLNGKL